MLEYFDCCWFIQLVEGVQGCIGLCFGFVCYDLLVWVGLGVYFVVDLVEDW